MSTMSGTPRRRAVVSAEELAASAGIDHLLLERVVGLGLVEPVAPGGTEFPAASARRLKRMLQLRLELGVNLPGASVIVDLLGRLERLKAELSALQGGCHGR